MLKITLKRGKEESVLRCHPWIFSGAVDSMSGNPAEGEIVDVYARDGRFLGRGHYQIGSITVRLLTFAQEDIDAAWWKTRIAEAYRLRQVLGLADDDLTTCYRLIHGEGDSLPGLIVDVYGNTAVVQCHSVGMFLSREIICDALREVYGERLVAVYDKSAKTVPFKAGLTPSDGYLWGSGDEANEIVLEGGNKFAVDWREGQKTGFFLDQRVNRELVGRYSRSRRVLNTFCYTGGFSVYALAGGAAEVVSVDSSAAAVEMAVRNAELNFGEGVKHRGVTADVFEFLKADKEPYDLIILDPPAFAKHRKALDSALHAYIRLNAQAMTKIQPGGLLFTFSCSQAVSREQFRNAVFTAATISGRSVRILHQLTQPADHPVNIYHPEGEYLKGLALYVE